MTGVAPEGSPVAADAATVRLARRFDCVLLASHHVNDPDHGPDGWLGRPGWFRARPRAGQRNAPGGGDPGGVP